MSSKHCSDRFPGRESWRVVFPQDIPIEGDCFETILLISDRLRSQFDLKRW